jgi:hypothetical protein
VSDQHANVSTDLADRDGVDRARLLEAFERGDP